MQNYNIDKVKFFAAIGVVLIHVFAFIDSAYNEPLVELQWPRALFNYAVPLFFAITGYILSSRTDRYILKYAGGIFRTYVIISLFYYIVNVLMAGLDAFLYKEPIMEAMQVIVSSKSWRNVVQGTVGSYHLWYLWASWIGILLFYVLRRLNLSPKKLIAVAFSIYLLSLYFLESGSFVDILRYGGFPKALMYTSLGYYVGAQRDYWKHSFLVLIMSVLMYVLSFAFFYRGEYIELLFIPVVYIVISFLNRYSGKENVISRMGRNFSDEIYLLHALGINVYGVLMFVMPQVLIHSLALRVILITLFAIVFSVLLYQPLNKFYIQPMQRLLLKVMPLRDREE